jgi:hypothetical protein
MFTIAQLPKREEDCEPLHEKHEIYFTAKAALAGKALLVISSTARNLTSDGWWWFMVLRENCKRFLGR